MVKGFESSVSESKQLAYNLTKPADEEILLECSIFLEPLVNENDARTHVKLQCKHEFHLDCIGSAFNAKNKMECPNCRNIEQGQWLYASGIIDGWFPEEEIDYEFLSDSEAYGMDSCPFEGYVHLNSTQWAAGHFSFAGRPCCEYHEYTITHPSAFAATGVTESSNFTNHLDTSSDEVFNLDGLPVDPLSHGSNPSDLIPLSLTPTNPWFFQSASHPYVIIARSYFSHPYTDPSPIFNNSLANVQVVPPSSPNNVLANSLSANVPLTRPYPNRSSAANGLVVPHEYNTTTIDWVSHTEEELQQYIERNLACIFDNIQRLLHNGEDGRGRGGSASGSGGGNNNNGGSG